MTITVKTLNKTSLKFECIFNVYIMLFEDPFSIERIIRSGFKRLTFVKCKQNGK